MSPPPALGVRPGARVLYLSQDPALIARQLAGERLTRAQAGPLRDDVSTDEITPVAILSHHDERLGDFAHTGLVCGGQQPIGTGALRRAGIEVLVAGRRYGKGSSREHSPSAEQFAGVRLVVAESFERIYRQNADNIGLFTHHDPALLDALDAGAGIALDALVAGREALAAAILRAGGLLRWGRTHLRPSAQTAAPPMPAGLSLFQRILWQHLLPVPGTPMPPQPGDGVFVRADWRFIHEYYTGMADTLLRRALADAPEALAVHTPAQVVVFEDHSSYVDESPVHQRLRLVSQMQAMVQAQRDFAQRHGLRLVRTLTEAEAHADDGRHEAGISHAVMAERHALPGQVVVGTDSHTPHSGALGCAAFGVGTTDMANALITGAVRVSWPGAVRVQLSGQLRPGVTAKDVVLALLAEPWVRQGGGLGQVFEFEGEGVAAMDLDERATLTNMCAELGGLSGLVAPDARTTAFLRARRGVDWVPDPALRADPDTRWTHTLALDLSCLSPWVARPGDPGQGLPLAALAEPVRIDIAYGGSCTAGKREDFVHYHAVLAWGLSRGLRPPPGVSVYLQYGTTAVRDWCRAQGFDATFAAMGVRVLQPSCGACANGGPGVSTRPEQVTVSAINRNFPGRSGPGQVWLASPPTVMASALAGQLISFEDLQRRVGA